MSYFLKKIPVVVTVGSVLILALAGCAANASGGSASGSTGTASPAASPAATIPATPVASKVEVSHEGFTILSSAGQTIYTTRFDSAMEPALTSLTSALGSAPVKTNVAKSSCNLDFTKYAWSGLSLSSAGATPFVPGRVFSLKVEAPRVATVAIEGIDGAVVGTSSAALAAAPGSVGDDIQDSNNFAYDLAPNNDSEGTSTGMFIDVDPAGRIRSIAAPVLQPDFC